MSKAKFNEFLSEETSGSPPPSDNAMRKFFNDIGSELKHQAEAGAHEVASALFTGQSFVLYARSEEAQSPGVHGEATAPPEVKPPEQEQRHGGIEM